MLDQTTAPAARSPTSTALTSADDIFGKCKGGQSTRVLHRQGHRVYRSAARFTEPSSALTGPEPSAAARLTGSVPRTGRA